MTGRAPEGAPPRPARWMAALCLAALVGATVGCDEGVIRDSMLIDLTGVEVRVVVTTRFKDPAARTVEEDEEIRRFLDLDALDRDPWIRGFRRAGARAFRVTRSPEGEQPELIVREGTLPDITSIERLMPDPLADFEIVVDEATGALDLTIRHLDPPSSIRDSWRTLDHELEAFAHGAWAWSESVCDLYDLRRREGPVVFGEAGSGPTPEATRLIEETSDRLMHLLDLTTPDPLARGSKGALAMRRFGAFDHALAVRLPAEAVAVEGFVRRDAGEGEFIYDIEAIDLDSLVAVITPPAVPPFEDLEPERLAERTDGPYTCRRLESVPAIRRSLWEAILPRPQYRLSWFAP